VDEAQKLTTRGQAEKHLAETSENNGNIISFLIAAYSISIGQADALQLSHKGLIYVKLESRP
jgi:hypothetical protein